MPVDCFFSNRQPQTDTAALTIPSIRYTIKRAEQVRQSPLWNAFAMITYTNQSQRLAVSAIAFQRDFDIGATASAVNSIADHVLDSALQQFWPTFRGECFASDDSNGPTKAPRLKGCVFDDALEQ